eukprot:2535622-Alexandrium_andersonii.AAC.1
MPAGRADAAHGAQAQRGTGNRKVWNAAAGRGPAEKKKAMSSFHRVTSSWSRASPGNAAANCKSGRTWPRAGPRNQLGGLIPAFSGVLDLLPAL